MEAGTFVMRLDWLVSTCYKFLLRGFTRVAFIIVFVTNSHVSRNLFVRKSAQKFFSVETHFHVKTGRLVCSADQLIGLYTEQVLV